MTLRKTSFVVKNILGGIYTFEKAGDVLFMHNHTEATAHISVVVCGKIKVQGEGWEREHSANDVIDFPADQPHEFTALEDDTRIVNIQKMEVKNGN
jgi:quercetin dioxygenase-like cupin family protein